MTGTDDLSALLGRDMPTLKVERACAASVRITLDRPEAMNALNTAMMGELKLLFEAINAAERPPRCVLITGAGERAFCAGADLKERQGMSDADWRAQHRILEDAVRAIATCPVPVIAAVNGAAIGGGCELALLADFIIASASARFGLPETKLGIIPGAGGPQTLTRAVGPARAKELIFSGRLFDAHEAHAMGLVLEVCDDVAARALETAQAIEANAPLAVRAAKAALRASYADFASVYAAELEAYDRVVETEDRREGVRAFNEKRAAKFEGR